MADIDSDFGKLIGTGQGDPDTTRDKQIAALLAHARHTNRSMLAMQEGVRAMTESVTQLTAKVDSLTVDMGANTQITTAVRDYLTAGRVAGKVIRGLGIAVITISAFWGAWWTIMHTGEPPASGGLGR